MTRKLSASSLDKWKTCKRRWAFNYIAGIKEPFAVSAQAGSEVHKRLEEDNIVPGERWNKYRVGDMAAALKVATPAGILTREEEFDVVLDGVHFGGFMDGRGGGTILDYKTTSKRKYAKSKKVLETDPQRLLYTEAHPDATNCVWVYGIWSELEEANSWNAYEPLVREVPVDRAKDRERFKLHVLTPAEEILTVTDGTDPLSLDANEKSCGLYPPAGCIHKNRCFPPVHQVSMSTKSSRLFDTLIQGEPDATAASAVSGVPARDLPGAGDVGSASAPISTVAPALGFGGVADSSDTGTPYAIEILFIDCFPLGRLDAPLNFSHPLISRASADVADDQGVSHARLIDYNKGMDMLAVRMADLVLAAPVKYLHLETKSKEGAACMNPLMGISRLVVKGAY